MEQLAAKLETKNDVKSTENVVTEFPSKEITLLLFNGMRLAGKAWGPKSSPVSRWKIQIDSLFIQLF